MTGSPAIRSDGVLEGFLAAESRFDLAGDITVADGSQAVVQALELLQDEADYRGALQRWFGLLAVGGVLVLTVPHAFLDARQDRLPVPRRPRQQRLYTPASLLGEVEEALVPNNYRLRWLADRDGGYDYALDRATPPTGQHDIALVLERIASPAWDLAPSVPAAVLPPEPMFEPLRTRVETMAPGIPQHILLLKLDHLGDFIMAVPALRAVRARFPDAHITLVVGEWNAALAGRIGVADEVLIFAAFPRNTAEAGVDIGARLASFDALVTARYDLAIDLRMFGDTRILLRNVDAAHKAGIGHGGAYPFLDIFLPLDPASEAVDHAWSGDIGTGEFFAQEACAHSASEISCGGLPAQDDPRIITWGPYRGLAPGEYQFRPFLDADFTQAGTLAYDIAIDEQRVAHGVFDGRSDMRVPFTVADPGGRFEFRLCAAPGAPVMDFRFRGGNLAKRGAVATLHQSEYLLLLVELVAMRLNGATLLAARDDVQ